MAKVRVELRRTVTQTQVATVEIEMPEYIARDPNAKHAAIEAWISNGDRDPPATLSFRPVGLGEASQPKWKLVSPDPAAESQ